LGRRGGGGCHSRRRVAEILIVGSQPHRSLGREFWSGPSQVGVGLDFLVGRVVCGVSSWSTRPRVSNQGERRGHPQPRVGPLNTGKHALNGGPAPPHSSGPLSAFAGWSRAYQFGDGGQCGWSAINSPQGSWWELGVFECHAPPARGGDPIRAWRPSSSNLGRVGLRSGDVGALRGWR